MDKPTVLLRWDLVHSYFLVVIGAVYLIASFQIAFDKYKCVSRGERVSGRITRLVETKSGGKAETYPVAAYATKKGKPREYRFDNPTLKYKLDDAVPLIVGPLPSCNVTIDRGGIMNYRLALTSGGISLLLLLTGLNEVPKRKKALKERVK